MNARIIQKSITISERELIPFVGEVDEENPPKPEYRIISSRQFKVNKYTAMDGLKIAKVLIAKILPVFQNFIPLLSGAKKGGMTIDNVLANFSNYISLENVADLLDKVSPADLDYIMQKSLQSVYEVLPAGDAQVMNADGTYGVTDVEYDAVLVLRLVCEAVLWGAGDFLDGNRLGSIMSPLFSS